MLITVSVSAQRQVVLLKQGDTLKVIPIASTKMIILRVPIDTATSVWSDSIKVWRRVISRADTSGAPLDTSYFLFGLKYLKSNTDSSSGIITSVPTEQTILLYDPVPFYRSDEGYTDALVFQLINTYYIIRKWKCIVDLYY